MGQTQEQKRAKKAEEMREYRKTHPRDRTAETAAATARRRALNRLAEAHPEEFERLLAEERAQVNSRVRVKRPRAARGLNHRAPRPALEA